MDETETRSRREEQEMAGVYVRIVGFLERIVGRPDFPLSGVLLIAFGVMLFLGVGAAVVAGPVAVGIVAGSLLAAFFVVLLVERRSVVRDAKLARFLGIPPTGGEVAIFVPIHETEEHPEGAEPYWVKSLSVAHVQAVVELATLLGKLSSSDTGAFRPQDLFVHETDVDSFRGSTMFLVGGPLPNPFVGQMIEDSPHLELEDSVDEIALRCKGLPRDRDRFVIRPPRGERTADQVERETTYGVVQKVAGERLTKFALWGLDERGTRGAARWLAENWSRPAKEFDEDDFVAIVQLPPLGTHDPHPVELHPDPSCPILIPAR